MEALYYRGTQPAAECRFDADSKENAMSHQQEKSCDQSSSSSTSYHRNKRFQRKRSAPEWTPRKSCITTISCCKQRENLIAEMSVYAKTTPIECLSQEFAKLQQQSARRWFRVYQSGLHQIDHHLMLKTRNCDDKTSVSQIARCVVHLCGSEDGRWVVQQIR